MTLPLEKQVCSLDLAKRLKELGVGQGSNFWWTVFFNRSSATPEEKLTSLVDADEYERMQERDYIQGCDAFSAFTVAELGEILRPHVEELAKLSHLLKKDNRAFFGQLVSADFWAECLIYLLEQKLITL